MDCLREEHEVRKWERLLGRELKRKEEEGGGERAERHGRRSDDDGGGGLRVRRVRILSGG